MARETVRYGPTAGRVTFHVRAVAPTAGTFNLTLTDASGGVAQETDGTVPSQHELDADPDALGALTLEVLGKYAPVKRGGRVHLAYVFTQQGAEIHRTVIDKELGRGMDFRHTNHKYTFEPTDAETA